mmetsp:Transcript_6946/g.10238  ORF Transcript_6946/g.10238 Transcript_6946/m.10238 type:complete len:204 (-) Transcript_6946:1005-1616(-)
MTSPFAVSISDSFCPLSAAMRYSSSPLSVSSAFWLLSSLVFSGLIEFCVISASNLFSVFPSSFVSFNTFELLFSSKPLTATVSLSLSVSSPSNLPSAHAPRGSIDLRVSLTLNLLSDKESFPLPWHSEFGVSFDFKYTLDSLVTNFFMSSRIILISGISKSNATDLVITSFSSIFLPLNFAGTLISFCLIRTPLRYIVYRAYA